MLSILGKRTYINIASLPSIRSLSLHQVLLPQSIVRISIGIHHSPFPILFPIKPVAIISCARSIFSLSVAMRLPAFKRPFVVSSIYPGVATLAMWLVELPLTFVCVLGYVCNLPVTVSLAFRIKLTDVDIFGYIMLYDSRRSFLSIFTIVTFNYVT